MDITLFNRIGNTYISFFYQIKRILFEFALYLIVILQKKNDGSEKSVRNIINNNKSCFAE